MGIFDYDYKIRLSDIENGQEEFGDLDLDGDEQVSKDELHEIVNSEIDKASEVNVFAPDFYEKYEKSILALELFATMGNGDERQHHQASTMARNWVNDASSYDSWVKFKKLEESMGVDVDPLHMIHLDSDEEEHAGIHKQIARLHARLGITPDDPLYYTCNPSTKLVFVESGFHRRLRKSREENPNAIGNELRDVDDAEQDQGYGVMGGHASGTYRVAYFDNDGQKFHFPWDTDSHFQRLAMDGDERDSDDLKTHELSHAMIFENLFRADGGLGAGEMALDGLVDYFAYRWVHEGLPSWLAEDKAGSIFSPLETMDAGYRRLDDPILFAKGFGGGNAAYYRGYLAFKYLEQTYGLEAVQDFAKSLMRGEPIEETLERITGRSLEEFYTAEHTWFVATHKNFNPYLADPRWQRMFLAYRETQFDAQDGHSGWSEFLENKDREDPPIWDSDSWVSLQIRVAEAWNPPEEEETAEEAEDPSLWERGQALWNNGRFQYDLEMLVNEAELQESAVDLMRSATSGVPKWDEYYGEGDNLTDAIAFVKAYPGMPYSAHFASKLYSSAEWYKKARRQDELPIEFMAGVTWYDGYLHWLSQDETYEQAKQNMMSFGRMYQRHMGIEQMNGEQLSRHEIRDTFFEVWAEKKLEAAAASYDPMEIRDLVLAVDAETNFWREQTGLKQEYYALPFSALDREARNLRYAAPLLRGDYKTQFNRRNVSDWGTLVRASTFLYSHGLIDLNDVLGILEWIDDKRPHDPESVRRPSLLSDRDLKEAIVTVLNSDSPQALAMARYVHDAYGIDEIARRAQIAYDRMFEPGKESDRDRKDSRGWSYYSDRNGECFADNELQLVFATYKVLATSADAQDQANAADMEALFLKTASYPDKLMNVGFQDDDDEETRERKTRERDGNLMVREVYDAAVKWRVEQMMADDTLSWGDRAEYLNNREVFGNSLIMHSAALNSALAKCYGEMIEDPYTRSEQAYALLTKVYDYANSKSYKERDYSEWYSMALRFLRRDDLTEEQVDDLNKKMKTVRRTEHLSEEQYVADVVALVYDESLGYNTWRANYVLDLSYLLPLQQQEDIVFSLLGKVDDSDLDGVRPLMRKIVPIAAKHASEGDEDKALAVFKRFLPYQREFDKQDIDPGHMRSRRRVPGEDEMQMTWTGSASPFAESSFGNRGSFSDDLKADIIVMHFEYMKTHYRKGDLGRKGATRCAKLLSEIRKDYPSLEHRVDEFRAIAESKKWR